MKNVVIGILGSSLDSGVNEERWHRWRPSVGLCQHEELLVTRFELFYESHDEPLARVVCQDLKTVSPETTVQLNELRLKDPWDFEEVFLRLHEFARNYRFRTDDENYLLHITTGTHVESTLR